MAASAVRPLRVAVVGASFGGLVLARTLQRAGPGFSVKVYEKSSDLRTDGSPIALLQGAGILHDLGLSGALDEIANRPQVVALHAQGKRPTIVATGGLTHLVARPVLRQVLAEAVDESLIVGRDVIAVDEGAEEAGLTFADGSRETADLVVAADGIGSTIAAGIFGKPELVWSGLRVLFATTAEPIRPDPSQVTIHLNQIGRDGHLLADWTAGSGDRACDGVAIVSRCERPPEDLVAPKAVKAEMRLLSAQADPLNRTRVAIIDASHQSISWGVYRQPARPSWFSARGRVALLGEAAHAVPPLSAQGANLAVQDGFCFGHRLANSRSLAEALRGYESVRKTPRERTAIVSIGLGYASTLMGWQATVRDAFLAQLASRLAREMHQPFVV